MKAVVIGAGIAGIASSIRLKLKGIDVAVFEANAYPGGKLAEFKEHGFRFDAGPSLFTLPHLVDELFELAGRRPEAYFNYEKLDTACHYFWDDGVTFFAPSNPRDFAEKASRVFQCSAEQVQRYFEQAEFTYTKTAPVFLEQSLHKWRNFFSPQVINAVGHMGKFHMLQSMNRRNEGAFEDPKLVQLFNRFATYNGSDPYRAPGILTMIPHLEHTIGAAFPQGGMHAITSSLVRLAVDLGVEFKYNEPVASIQVENKQAVGVTTSNATYSADLVVSNMDVVSTYRNLLPYQKAPERTLSQERSSSAFIFYWGVNRTFEQLDLHNIFFSSDYAAEFDALFNGENIYSDPTVYVHISSKYRTEDAPEGKENWFVMVNAPRDQGQDWENQRTFIRDAIVRKLNRVLDVDLAKCIESESILTPKTIETKTGSLQGSLYGTSSNSKWAAFMRHPNFSKSIAGLYFVGGSVHPGGGIPLCLRSAKIMSESVNV